MCGIVGCIVNENATAKVVEGLKKLEYRGYDSWGVGVLSDDASEPIKTIKKTGKIGEVDTAKIAQLVQGTSKVAIGHTRWATHGGISKTNSHPHLDCKGEIAVVHNGVIDNYQELKEMLTEHNHKFVSQTDTEVLPHLLEEFTSRRGMSFVDAALEVARMLKGRSAFVAINSKTNELVGARMGSPLIMGLAQEKTNEFYISSDISAFLSHTNKIIYIDNGEMASLNFGDNVATSSPKFFNIQSGSDVSKRIVEIDWKNSNAEKTGYDHFLIKEIMEQKHTVANAVSQNKNKIATIAKEIKRAKEVYLIGCGTSGKVCKAGEYLFSKIAGKHVTAMVASEFGTHSNSLSDKSLVIAISQSGETADVLEAIEVAQSKHIKVISILNTFGSTMMRISDDYLLINAGAERSVASTKATTSQLSVITLLAYATVGKLNDGNVLLLNTSSAIDDMLNPRYEDYVKKLAGLIKDNKGIFIIGRGINSAMAEEAAIKIQETCVVQAHGFAGGELKHGPLALIENGSVCLTLVANDETKSATLSNAMEVKARGGYIVGIAPENNEIFDYWLRVPDAGYASEIVSIIPVQLLAYYLSVLLGKNPDYPRNLAKSVTVL